MELFPRFTPIQSYSMSSDPRSVAEPTRTYTLSDPEYERLVERLVATLSGETGLALGFTAEDYPLFEKFGFEFPGGRRTQERAEPEERPAYDPVAGLRKDLAEAFRQRVEPFISPTKSQRRAEYVAWHRRRLMQEFWNLQGSIRGVAHDFARSGDPALRTIAERLVEAYEILHPLKPDSVPPGELEHLESAEVFERRQAAEPPLNAEERSRRETLRQSLLELIRRLTLDMDVPDYRYGLAIKHAHRAIGFAIIRWMREAPPQEQLAAVRAQTLEILGLLGARDPGPQPKLRVLLQRLQAALKREPGCFDCGNEAGTCPCRRAINW